MGRLCEGRIGRYLTIPLIACPSHVFPITELGKSHPTHQFSRSLNEDFT